MRTGEKFALNIGVSVANVAEMLENTEETLDIIVLAVAFIFDKLVGVEPNANIWLPVASVFARAITQTFKIGP
ncbi:hypothetical protein [Sphingomonas sp.]|uniref:hypothetical protein n=1 Tax=Sphingomonas sp. TaxID=28214 RepID=UPI003BAB9EE5